MAASSTTEATTELLHCAEALAARAIDGGDIAALADELDHLADALGVVAHACERAATRVLPPAGHDVSVCRRYQSAVASWPSTPLPSYERLAMLMGSLRELAGAVRVATCRCEHAKHALDAAVGQTRRPCPER
jgi:hypothetical protein